MATAHPMTNETLTGTITGTALALGCNIGSPDIVRTVLLATLGATASFMASLLLKWLYRKIKS
jgi:hypothetical protein